MRHFKILLVIFLLILTWFVVSIMKLDQNVGQVSKDDKVSDIVFTNEEDYSNAAEGEIRIMPLGDSITGAEVSYREPLYKKLVAVGYDNINFVGSEKNLVDGGWDKDHEGHGGWRAEDIRDYILVWLNENPPDIILLHLGTNDINDKFSNTSTVKEINQILDYIDEWEETNNPVKILFAMIVKTAYHNDEVLELNDLYEGAILERIKAGDDIEIVNMENIIDPLTDLKDGIHPTKEGSEKMAEAWYDALKNILSANK